MPVGLWCNSWYIETGFHTVFPSWVKVLTQDINNLECWSVLVALRVWANAFSRKNILIYCDNENTVRAINSGGSRDVVMQSLLRNLHWECAKQSISVQAVHCFGSENRKADF